MIDKKIKKLRAKFKDLNIDGYIVPKNDEFFSEYSQKNRLKIISNFSGSAGLAVILKKKNYLFVDGRYTLQAEIECGKYFKIIEIPKILPKEILKKLNKKLVIGYDPQLFTSLNLKKLFGNSCNLSTIDTNLIDKIYKEKPKKHVNPFYHLDANIAGESVNNKINRLIKKIKKDKIDNIFISAPENVAWLLNLRGRDNPYSPIPNCKIILTKNKKIYFFSCPKKINIIKKLIHINNFNFVNIIYFHQL